MKVRLARFCSSSLRRLHSREAPPAVGPRGLLSAPQTRPRDRGSVPVLRPDLGFPSGAAGDPSGDTGTSGSGRGLLDAAQRPGPVAGPEKLSPGSPPEPAPLSTCLQRHSSLSSRRARCPRHGASHRRQRPACLSALALVPRGRVPGVSLVPGTRVPERRSVCLSVGPATPPPPPLRTSPLEASPLPHGPSRRLRACHRGDSRGSS